MATLTAWSLAAPLGASAATATCDLDGATGILSIAVPSGGIARISRAGDDIVLDGVICVGATAVTTETIEVTGDAAGGETVLIDLSGGAFAPGRTDESDGSSEIEFALPDMDDLWVYGSDGADSIVVSATSVNLNADEAVSDIDVAFEPISYSTLFVRGRAGDDRIALLGGPYGPSLFSLAYLFGGAGDDTFVAETGDGEERYRGGLGRDVVDNSAATIATTLGWEDGGTGSILHAGGGADGFTSIQEVRLGSGDDWVIYEGDTKGDTFAGPGDDDVWIVELNPDDPAAERLVHGGPGPDQLYVATDDELGIPLVVDLDRRTVRGAWHARYAGFASIRAGGTEDRFIARERRGYPTFSGGPNIDELWLGQAGRRMFVALSAAPNDEFPWLVPGEIERVIGTPFDDVLVGDDTLVNTLVGIGGDDVLVGNDGFDYLYGGPGDDVLRGGPGTDTCDGGPGRDRIFGCEA